MTFFRGTKYSDILIGTDGSGDPMDPMGGGNDVLDGAGGADLMIGGGGDDVYVVDTSGDMVYELDQPGRDTVRSSITYTLTDNVEDLQLTGVAAISGTGNAAENSLTGNLGNNTLSGLNGDDTLVGAGGNDRLIGGLGNDTLRGDQGLDTAVYSGAMAGYNLGIVNGELAVKDIDTIKVNEGTDSLDGVEKIVFSDGTLTVDYDYAPFRVNTPVYFDHYDPSTAVLSDGSFVVVWAGNNSRSGFWEIYGQRYDAQGTALGGQFPVSTLDPDRPANMQIPNVAALSTGGFVVTWDRTESTEIWDVCGQRFNSDGERVGTEFIVNENALPGMQYNNQVFGLDGGGFAVSFVDSDNQRTVTNLFKADGEFAEAIVKEDHTQTPAIISFDNSNGLNLTAYSLQGPANTDIQFEYFFNNGDVALGEGFDSGRHDVNPALANLSNGGFVVAWSTYNNENTEADVRALILGLEPMDLERTIQVTSTNNLAQGSPYDIQVAGLADGGFVVTWSMFTDMSTIHGQRYNADGTAVGEEFQVNPPHTNSQNWRPSLTSLEDGGFLITWASTDDTGTDIYAQRFAADGTVAGITGDAGNNTLSFINGAGHLEGGKGNDIYLVDDNDVVVEEFNGGIDTVKSSVSFTLSSNLENLTLTGTADIDAKGNELANVLTGNSGANVLDGGLGIDKFAGGAGNDTYIIQKGEIITETSTGGIDTVVANFSYTLGSYVENLQFLGIGNLIGTGNTLNNSIRGSYGVDKLNGGSGNDTLDGSYGNDTLTGGAGFDTFVFSTPLGGNVDTITDFDASFDAIVLDQDVFSAIGTGLLFHDSFVLATIAGKAGDRILYDQPHGALFYDADGGGGAAAIQFADLKDGTIITAADFTIL